MKQYFKLVRTSIAATLLAMCVCTNAMDAVHAESAEEITETVTKTEDGTQGLEEQKEGITQNDIIQEDTEKDLREEIQGMAGKVRVLSKGSGVDHADITSSGGKKMDGIYYSEFTINGGIGYCLQSSKDTPQDAIYDVQQELDAKNSFLSKAMYYAYGNPGYRAELWIPDCPGDTARAYLRSHLVLSYIHDEGNTLDREITDAGWLPWWKNYIVQTISRLQAEPGVPEAELSLSSVHEEAYFDKKQKVQRTRSITLKGDVRNQITFPLPKGVILVNETKKTEGKAVVSGGDSFYFKSDVAALNGEAYNSGELKGSIDSSWATLLVQTGGDTQDMGLGVLYKAQAAAVSLAVKWIPAPKLLIEKNVDRESKVYKKGELITYTLEITQQIPHAVAKHVVIEDGILTEGVKLQKNSIVLLDGEKNVIKDAKISVKGNDIHIEGGSSLEFLEYVENGERLYVEYQVLVISDEVELIKNIAKARAENAPEETDEEEVEVEPEPEPEPEPEVEEPKPEPPAPTPEPPKPPKTVQTGDNNTPLIVLILSLILSCTAIVKYGRIAHRK